MSREDTAVRYLSVFLDPGPLAVVLGCENLHVGARTVFLPFRDSLLTVCMSSVSVFKGLA